MIIRVGCELEIDVATPTAVVAMVDVHPERSRQVVRQSFKTASCAPVHTLIDGFGNKARRFIAGPGPTRFSYHAEIADDGRPDELAGHLDFVPVAELPFDCMTYLAGSRYCETDRLSDFAWSTFGGVPEGGQRAQAVVDFVHRHIRFDYALARSTRTAFEALNERVGVCRDFTHLAVALCRALNMPARYVNGYLGDIGVPPDPAPMDFSAWMEVYLGGRWLTLDARHNKPRIGRVVIARGRDAADVAMITTFGPHVLSHFHVVAEEIATVAALDRRIGVAA
ncbi:MAG: transglutaminase-like domain-containing protein [Hyphomicrobium sp.]